MTADLPPDTTPSIPQLPEGDLRAGLASSLEGLAQVAIALRSIAATIYDGRVIADARSLAAEAHALRVASSAQLQVADIVDLCAAEFDVTPRQIYGASRIKPVKAARWAVFQLAHRRGVSLAEIGRSMGVDHTTVRNALKRMASTERGAS